MVARAILAVMFVLFLCAGAASAANRNALVIGNSNYQHVPELPNPKNDAAAVAGKLKSIGFEVIEGRDLTLIELRRSVRDFVNALSDADLALFFYAGHGLQVNGSNYLAPVDARLETYDDLDFEALPIDLILSAMERKSSINLVFLDACRNNPLARNLARSMGTRSTAVGRGLARISSGVGTLISFSTQPGNVALDGTGRNSPFTSALVRHIGTPGEDIARSMRNVRNDVLAATDGKQVPWENSSLTGDVILVERPKTEESAGDPTPTPAGDSPTQVEIIYWNSIKDADSKAFFQSYLANYPQGLFADIAKLKISDIERSEQATAAIEQTTSKGTPATDTADRVDVQTEVAALAPEAGPGNDDQPPEQMDEKLLVRSIQNELNRLGCSPGTADGVWGSNTKRGLRKYARNAGTSFRSLDPSAKLLDDLKRENGRVCPAGLLANLNGNWTLERVATASCGWKSMKSTVRIRDGAIGNGSTWKGEIDDRGRIRMKHFFIHNGRQQSNSLSGRIKNEENGQGTFRHDQGGCRGRFTLTRF